jgi:hypothetical protein
VAPFLPDEELDRHRHHPEGEEIFVIEGTFSDHLGDAHAGTHLLNPEGFSHAPHSEPGCTILVKLRQYGGEGREFHRTQTRDMTWSKKGARFIHLYILDQRLYRMSKYVNLACAEQSSGKGEGMT